MKRQSIVSERVALKNKCRKCRVIKQKFCLYSVVMKHCVSIICSIVLLLPVVCGLTSCIFEDSPICPEKMEFTIVPEFPADGPGIPSGSLQNLPEGMAYLFFPSDGSPVWRFDLPGCGSGKVMMSPGNYSFLSFNDDTSSVLFRGENSYGTYEAYTVEADLLGNIPLSLRGNGAAPGGEERVVACPEMMWGSSYYGFSLGYDGLSYIYSASTQSGEVSVFSPDFILKSYEFPLTARYVYRIEDVKNLSGVKSMSAALTGMAGSIMLASGQKGSYPSTLSLKASSSDSSTIGSSFYTFGLPLAPTAPNVLNLFVVLTDGRRFCYKFDVTTQVREASDPMNVEIVVRDLTIDVPDSGGTSGFDVNVDGWITEIVNIKS